MRLPLLLGGLLAVTLNASALDFIATNVYSTSGGEVVESEQWILAGKIEPSATFENDLNALTGNPLLLDGVYQGNVSAIASVEATHAGVATRNLRLGASTTVRILGQVGENLVALADTIVIGTNAVIGGDAILIANSVVIEGVVEGDARVTAGRVATLAGTIEGDARVRANEVLFARGAEIRGNLTYQVPKELYPGEDVVRGETLREFPPSLFEPSRLKMIGMWFVAALLAGVPFVSLFPMTTAMASQLARRSPFKCLFVGFLAAMALPMFGLMCVSSLVGLPLGGLLIGSWAILFYLSRIIMGLVIGTLILRTVGASVGRVLLAMALGLLIIYAAAIVPNIGVPIQLIVLWMGMGSLILALIEKRRLILQVPANLKKLEALRDEKSNPEEK